MATFTEVPSALRTRYAGSSPVVEGELKTLLPFVTSKTISKNLTARNAGYKHLVPGGHARNYYNPAAGQVYTRYSDKDWLSSAETTYTVAQTESNQGERLRAEAFATVRDCDARARMHQLESKKKLCERKEDIAFWKNELNKEIDAMETEIANLTEYKRVLEKVYAESMLPLHSAEECIMNREKRMGIDLVNDEVERMLCKEVEVIKKCQRRMLKMVEKANQTLKLDRAIQHAMEIDAGHKHHAQGIDERMHQLHNSSAGIGYFPGIEMYDNTITVPATWVAFTQENLARSQKQRADSEKLRNDIDLCLRQCATEMWNAWNATNNALNTRIRETSDVKNKMQAFLQKTMKEIMDMERNIDLIRKSIFDKEAYLKVAQTRLEERTRRIHVEACADGPMKSLIREVRDLQEQVRLLREKLRRAENTLARLMKTKTTLEEQIGVKENTLMIDGRYCMALRNAFPLDGKVAPIVQMPTC